MLARPACRKVWVARTVSQSGDVAQFTTVALLVLQLTGSGIITGHAQFTHLAGVHGSLAATRPPGPAARSVAGETVPRVTYTQPEVAAAGVSTSGPGDGMRVLTWEHAHVDRAVAEDQTAGMTRLVVDRRGRISGVTIRRTAGR